MPCFFAFFRFSSFQSETFHILHLTSGFWPRALSGDSILITPKRSLPGRAGFEHVCARVLCVGGGVQKG